MTAAALLLTAALQAARLQPSPPPVIPHPVEPGAACTDCHGAATQGGVPAIPHRVRGFCRSCHVAQTHAKDYRPNGFRAEAAGPGGRARTQAGVPPAIPHDVFMRENCQACHGRERHRGMRKNPHPERANCTSCHLA